MIVVFTPLDEHTQSIRTNEHTTETEKPFYLFEIKLDRQRDRCGKESDDEAAKDGGESVCERDKDK